VADAFSHGKQPSGAITSRECREQLRDCQLLRDSAAWSYRKLRQVGQCSRSVPNLEWEAHPDQNIFSASRTDLLLFLILATGRFKGSQGRPELLNSSKHGGNYMYHTRHILPTQCVPCILRINSDCSSQTVLTGSSFSWRRNVFPVRYGLNLTQTNFGLKKV
jgi:hypothetical protein